MAAFSFIDNFPFSPTTNQRNALDALTTFANYQNPYHIFLLKGYAGTGKTSLLAHISYEYNKVHNVVLLAPTGRAAKVLSDYCKLPAFTIHKKIYRLFDNPDGERQFMLQKNNYKDTLFIVDECSMISSGGYAMRDLLEDMMRFVFRGKNCRLILAGDTAQLPPVDMDFSPALNKEYLEYNFKFPVTEVELTEVVRQVADSGILYNATQLREQIVHQNAVVCLETDLPNIWSINGMELQEKLEQSYHAYGADEVLFVTRSNKRANQFNQEIRNRLLFREEKLSGGDLVMAVKNNYHWLPKEEQQSSFIANGESMEVKQVYGTETMYGFEFADARVSLISAKGVDVDVKLWLDALDVNGPSMTQQDHNDLYYKVYNDYLGVKNEKPVKEMVKSDNYYNALQVKFSYAVTCHKSQGGQWDAVFVDHGYLTDEMIDVNFLRWLYTAITRAKKELYLVNFNEAFLS